MLELLSEHHVTASTETPSILKLPALLASFLSLRESFTFRPNATQALRDILEVVLLHTIEKGSHLSRFGEEGADLAQVLRTANWSNMGDIGSAVYSDADHPAVKYMATSIWPSGQSSCIRVAHLLMGDSVVEPQEIVQCYIDALHNDRKEPLVVIIPHVVWFNGRIMPVRQICQAIKSHWPLSVTVVDGAQAVGHVPLSIEECSRENPHIDFYVGCCHKWLMGPETLGFMRVGERFRKNCRRCVTFLAVSDCVTDSSAIGFQDEGTHFGTQQRGMALSVLAAVSELEKRFKNIESVHRQIMDRSDCLRHELRAIQGLISMEPNEKHRSGIISFSFRENDRAISKVVENRLEQNGYHTARYQSDLSESTGFAGKWFLRLSPSPYFPITESKNVADIIAESFAHE